MEKIERPVVVSLNLFANMIYHSTVLDPNMRQVYKLKAVFSYPKNPDPSKVAILRTPKQPCYKGSNPSIGGYNDSLPISKKLKQIQVAETWVFPRHRVHSNVR